MKKLSLSFLIFIFLFFIFNIDSFALGSGVYNEVSFISGGSRFEVYPSDSSKGFFVVYARDSSTWLLLGASYSLNGSPRGVAQFSLNSTTLSENFLNGFFPNYDSAFDYYYHYVPTSYDDNIGALMNLDMSIVYKLSSGVQARLNWNMPDNVDHVKLVIAGTYQTNTYELNGSSYWFNLSDYGNLNDTVHVYLTPYDSDGNWGNTMTLSTVVDPVIASYVAQSYKGYYRRVTNPAGSGYVDIVGTSDVDVNVIVEKPDSSGSVSGSPTIVRNYHSYSPVFEYNTSNEDFYQEVINNYVTNNNVVNNNYQTIVNNIDLSTNINIDFDAYFDIDNVTQTCQDIKNEIHQAGNDFSDLFSLFDVVCPFFNGVGAKALSVFKWVIGIVGGFVGIKVLKAFL